MIKKEYTYTYCGRQIRYHIWLTSSSSSLDFVIFLGTMQISSLHKWVAEFCPARTAIVQGAPYWDANKDADDTSTYMFGYTDAVFKEIAKRYHFQYLNIFAESQAAPGVVRFLTRNERYRPRIKEVTLIQPLGFNPHTYTSQKDSVATFRRRILKNSRHHLIPLIVDSRLRHSYSFMHKRVNFSDSDTRKRYDSGLRHNILDDLEQLLPEYPYIKIVCGSRDEIFPVNEIRASLQNRNIGIPLFIVDRVAHSTLASRQGSQLLSAAFEIAK